MSEKQFWAAVERHGMKRVGFMGYVELGLPNVRTSVSIWNVATVGPRGKVTLNFRRALAYLLAKKAEDEKRFEAGAA